MLMSEVSNADALECGRRAVVLVVAVAVVLVKPRAAALFGSDRLVERSHS